MGLRITAKFKSKNQRKKLKYACRSDLKCMKVNLIFTLYISNGDGLMNGGSKMIWILKGNILESAKIDPPSSSLLSNTKLAMCTNTSLILTNYPQVSKRDKGVKSHNIYIYIYIRMYRSY